MLRFRLSVKILKKVMIYMGIIITLSIVFFISFMLIFKLVYSGNKEESEKEKLGFFGVIFVVFLLALLPTAAIAFFLFVLLGSTNAINTLFSLQIGTKQVIFLAISLFVYLFSIDSIIEIVVKHIVGQRVFYFFIMMLIRILASYTIGLFIGLNQNNSLIIAAGVSFIIFLFEVLYFMKTKQK